MPTHSPLVSEAVKQSAGKRETLGDIDEAVPPGVSSPSTPTRSSVGWPGA
ncbi:hypothetical protein [uncultured Friedmanniella sp.]